MTWQLLKRSEWTLRDMNDCNEWMKLSVSVWRVCEWGRGERSGCVWAAVWRHYSRSRGGRRAAQAHRSGHVGTDHTLPLLLCVCLKSNLISRNIIKYKVLFPRLQLKWVTVKLVSLLNEVTLLTCTCCLTCRGNPRAWLKCLDIHI